MNAPPIYRWLLLVAVATIAVASSQAGGAVSSGTWVIKDLGLEIRFDARINDRGQVTFESLRREHAFLWSKGKLTDLGTLGGRSSSPVAINNRGQVVGESLTGDSDPSHTAVSHAFLWEGGRMQDLGTLGGFWSAPYAINDRGQVVGFSEVTVSTANKDSLDQHAFLWGSGSMRDLGTLGGYESWAYAINERGQVAGESNTPDVRGTQPTHGFLWVDGRMRNIRIPRVTAINDHGVVVGPDRLWRKETVVSLRPLVEALDVNDAGQVVGYCLLKHRATPCTWRNGRVERLPLLRGGDRGQAVAINDRGQIVGWTNYAARQPLTHAVIWEHGTITDLGTVAGTWSQATDINNKGQIAGSSSVRNGNPHAVLWTQRTP